MSLRAVPSNGDVRVIVGDTHGDHVNMVRVLREAGAIDERGRRVPGYWTCHIGDVIHAGHGEQAIDVECLERALEYFDCLIYGNHETPFAVGLGSFVGQNEQLDCRAMLDDPAAVASAINAAFESRMESRIPETPEDPAAGFMQARASLPCQANHEQRAKPDSAPLGTPPTQARGWYIELSVDLADDQRGVVRLQHGDVVAELKAAGLSLPYPLGLKRLLANQEDIDLVVVERAPPGLREAAENAGINYLDLAGGGRVIAPGLVYVASPRRDPGGITRVRPSPFATKASRVVRVLLSDPKKAWRLSDVALLSHLNPGNVHRALAALLDRGMVERDEDAYVVADPGSLLEAWADQQQEPRERVLLDPGGNLRPFISRLVDELGGRAVVSGELAAEELAPHLPAESAIVHCFDERRFAELPRDDRPLPFLPVRVRPGQVLVDLADEGYGAFRLERAGMPLASPLQVYVDLARDRGRGREAAEHLREQVLGF